MEKKREGGIEFEKNNVGETENRVTVSRAEQRVARKNSRETNVSRGSVAAIMSSLGISSMAVLSVYYRFSWQMEIVHAWNCCIDPCKTQIYSITESWGKLVTSTPKKEANNDSTEEKAEPTVAYSKPPPLPPVIGPVLVALSLLEAWPSCEGDDD